MKNSQKDILFLCQFFYPENNSSATLPFDTAKYLANNKFTVDALCGYPKEYNTHGQVPYKENVDNVGIHRIKYIQLGRKKKVSRLINYFSFTLSTLMRLPKFRNYKSVIVYSNPPILPLVAVIANLIYKTKIIFVSYDVYPEVAYASHTLMPGSVIERCMSKLNESLYKRVDRVVSLTDEMKQFLLTHRSKITEDRITTIANWAHESKSEVTEEAFLKFGYSSEQFIVAYFGNMGICQEMETLLSAIKELKDNNQIKFLFIGHGSKKEYIEQFIKNEKLKNVQILGFLTGKDYQQAVAIASCCVVSLEKNLIGMCAPSKYYSYLQGGKPVLTIGQKESYLTEEVNREKIGKSVEIGNVSELVQAIDEMANNRNEAKEMGKRAQMLYEREYTLDIGLAKYAAMMREIL